MMMAAMIVAIVVMVVVGVSAVVIGIVIAVPMITIMVIIMIMIGIVVGVVMVVGRVVAAAVVAVITAIASTAAAKQRHRTQTHELADHSPFSHNEERGMRTPISPSRTDAACEFDGAGEDSAGKNAGLPVRLPVTAARFASDTESTLP